MLSYKFIHKDMRICIFKFKFSITLVILLSELFRIKHCSKISKNGLWTKKTVFLICQRNFVVKIRIQS